MTRASLFTKTLVLIVVLFGIIACATSILSGWNLYRNLTQEYQSKGVAIAKSIADSSVAIEVSTAGLRKPVAEIYPAPAFLEMCIDAGRPVALSSDAHTPDQLGYEYDRALRMLGDLGVEQIAVFDRRGQRLEALG